MGNACVVPSMGKKGCFHPVSSALWKARTHGEALPAADANGKDTNGDVAERRQPPLAAHSIRKAPEPANIASNTAKVQGGRLVPKPADQGQPPLTAHGIGKAPKPVKIASNTAKVVEARPVPTPADQQQPSLTAHETGKAPKPMKIASNPAKVEEARPVPKPADRGQPPLTSHSIQKATEPVKIASNTTKVEEAKPVPKPASSATSWPPSHHPKVDPMNRVWSAGLLPGSVLKRKTESVEDKYILGRRLGQGKFGTTYMCVERSTGRKYACKSILKRELVTDYEVENVQREIQIMYHLAGHPNVISIRGAYEDAVAVHLVMELCTGEDLCERIVQKGHYTERKAAELARVIIGVVEVCHSMGVMHRDLKPENLMFVDRTEEAALKTIDFGLSVFFRPGQIFTDVVGSPYYVAPEVLKKKYGPEADVWSAGVVIYALLCGVPPFWAENQQDIFEEVLHGKLDFQSESWLSISEGAKDLVRRMLLRDPKRRLTAREALWHPWVQQVGVVAPDKPLDFCVLSRMKQFSAMNKLKKMTLRVIARNLPEDEIAGLKEMFKMIDLDNSGQITYEELNVGLKKVGANLQESEIYVLMKAIDLDNSGTIDYGEFIAATLHHNKVDREDHLLAAFQYLDKDGSGYITPDELQLACEEFGLGANSIHLDDMIREVDQDNNGRIGYNEFVAMMQKPTLLEPAAQEVRGRVAEQF